VPNDAPYPGFELVTYDNESFTYGTLWNIGKDSGMTRIGKGIVYGQLWRSTNNNSIEELIDFIDQRTGTLEKAIVTVEVKIQQYEIQTKIDAVTFFLTKIQKEYNIIDDGYWLIQREYKNA
jgi:gamma-glutamylcyclotransferase (GGCT)/AIG2-like uncharacterized protein YtfP